MSSLAPPYTSDQMHVNVHYRVLISRNKMDKTICEKHPSFDGCDPEKILQYIATFDDKASRRMIGRYGNIKQFSCHLLLNFMYISGWKKE